MKSKHFVMIVCSILFFFVLNVNSFAEVRLVPSEYPTINEAVNAGPSPTGEEIEIIVAAGEHAGAGVWHPVIIRGEEGAIITSGAPVAPDLAFGLWGEGASGTEISNLTIINNNPDSGIVVGVWASGDTHDVYIHDLTILNIAYGIINLNGNGWNISHNKIITDNNNDMPDSGGIIIGTDTEYGEPENRTVRGNLVAYNETEGGPNNIDGKPDWGILLWNNGLFNMPDMERKWEISRNIIYYNKCSHTKGIGIGFLSLPPPPPWWTAPLSPDAEEISIMHNVICFNNLQGSAIGVSIDPVELEDDNIFFGNLGKKGSMGLSKPGISIPRH